MTKIKALHDEGLNIDTILDLAQTDRAVRGELMHLLERYLAQKDKSSTLSSQARFAMRLSASSKPKGVRHSEL